MFRPRALENIRVVDFSWVRAGPWATRWLGAFGAEIIKIEWPENERGRLPSTTTPQNLEVNLNTSGNFNDTNVNKKSLSLNVRSAKGLEIVTGCPSHPASACRITHQQLHCMLIYVPVRLRNLCPALALFSWAAVRHGNSFVSDRAPSSKRRVPVILVNRTSAPPSAFPEAVLAGNGGNQVTPDRRRRGP